MYRYIFRGFVDDMLLDFGVRSNNRRRQRLYVTGEGRERIDHIMEELVTRKGAIIVRVPPVIKLSGCQERLLESKNWEFILVVGSTETKTDHMIISR